MLHFAAITYGVKSPSHKPTILPFTFVFNLGLPIIAKNP
jgi:hypothetical protein